MWPNLQQRASALTWYTFESRQFMKAVQRCFDYDARVIPASITLVAAPANGKDHVSSWYYNMDPTLWYLLGR